MTKPLRGPAALRTDSMPAWTQHRYGGADVVALENIDVPAPRRGEVLLRLRATGLNNGDIRVMRGEPLLVRLAFGLRRPRQAVRGMDAAATVVGIGDGVTELAVGDEVVGELPAGGGLARFAVAPVGRLVRRPAELDAAVAASLPVAGGTAWQALQLGAVTDAAPPGASPQRVLVIGASGGVGTFAVQLAAGRGAEVWALCGQRNLTLVEGLGASHTFDYRHVQPGSAELGEGRFDAVIDIAGTASQRDLQRLVRDGGRVVLVSGEGGRVLGPIGRIAAAALRSIGSKRPLRPLAAVAKPDVLAELLALAAAGRLSPVIERRYPFAEADAALARVADGHVAGKVVVLAE
ncbi:MULTISPECIES: NAD(P)-dependent alcohol dehydrogenase [Microbacterium]|uniref:NAD(P)-dependent alcohol dehydrogenase n=1 Tax=Microbacterium TaxID=33882 RepID=UPI0028591EED|nr:MULTISPECIES: NAD(P)-dependent alcohol dehydrogenase [Microbacterium]MDR7113142.1 NADPH:quinone reductase-like Zn-dependent oxidoreductase [Microbacterium trichothecenolyticum]MDT0143388.1 NAD(P)-dependent alcohol dehydrogenase [Microbacterium sp. PRC9]